MSHQRHTSSLASWALPPLVIQCIALNWSAPLTLPTWALVLCTMFKLRECRWPFDRRLVALLQLLSTGLLAAQLQGLLASFLQLVAVFLALAGLLGHELAGALSFRGFLQRSLQLLAAALPLALVLFLFVPRFPPLWTTQLGPTRGAVSGLSPELDPLSIAELALVDGSAARVLLPDGELPPTDSYWRVLVHEEFDGRRWKHRDPDVPSGGSGRPQVGEGSSQWWVVEPSATRAVPWDGSASPTSPDQWITPEGELLVGAASRQRRSFRLQSTQLVSAWQQRFPVSTERQSPPESLPRLKAFARQLRQLPTGRERLEAAERWFRRQPFRYSLQPGAVADLDEFLFDQQVGFCGHYASALAALMRAADVPARVVSGYQGGHVVQPISGGAYLELRQRDAHAWAEVWLEGEGWQRVDPTHWATTTGLPAASAAATSEQPQEKRVPWWRWLQWQWWGLDLAWTRWWLSFDQASQRAWLQMLFGSQLRWLGVTVVLTGFAGVAGGWLLLRVELRPRSPLVQSLRLLEGLGVVPLQGESFSRLCLRAASMRPDLAMIFKDMADKQQLLAHAPLTSFQRRHHLRKWRQIRSRLRRLR